MASAGWMTVVIAVAAPAAGRETLAVHAGWGAFRDRGACYAIARPVVAGGRVGGFASVADWPRRGLRASLHLRLTLPRDRAAPATLAIGERRFRLVGTERDLWAGDAATDRAIVSALRGARSMSVEAVTARGRSFADSYALAGAATAIDAARLGCLSR